MKTRLRPPCFIEVPLSIKEIEWVCIYVCWGIDFVYFHDFSIIFLNCSDDVLLSVFHFIIILHIILSLDYGKNYLCVVLA